MITLTLDEWRAKGKEIFGSDNPRDWKFKCVSCGHVQCYDDFKGLVDEPENVFYFSCIGRWKKGVGCDWTLGGLLRFHGIEVTSQEGENIPVFNFANPDAPDCTRRKKCDDCDVKDTCKAIIRVGVDAKKT